MHNWTNSHLYFSHHPRSPRDFTQNIESYTYFYYGNFGIDLQTTQRVCIVLIIVNFLHIFVFVEFTRNVGWTTVYLRQRSTRPEVSEDVGMVHELRLWMSCVSVTQYFSH